MEERAEISRDEKALRDEEIDWLSGVLARLERDKTFFLVAEVDVRVIGLLISIDKEDMKSISAWSA